MPGYGVKFCGENTIGDQEKMNCVFPKLHYNEFEKKLNYW